MEIGFFNITYGKILPDFAIGESANLGLWLEADPGLRGYSVLYYLLYHRYFTAPRLRWLATWLALASWVAGYATVRLIDIEYRSSASAPQK